VCWIGEQEETLELMLCASLLLLLFLFNIIRFFVSVLDLNFTIVFLIAKKCIDTNLCATYLCRRLVYFSCFRSLRRLIFV
jgi:hypothetical protein